MDHWSNPISNGIAHDGVEATLTLQRMYEMLMASCSRLECVRDCSGDLDRLSSSLIPAQVLLQNALRNYRRTWRMWVKRAFEDDYDFIHQWVRRACVISGSSAYGVSRASSGFRLF